MKLQIILATAAIAVLLAGCQDDKVGNINKDSQTEPNGTDSTVTVITSSPEGETYVGTSASDAYVSDSESTEKTAVPEVTQGFTSETDTVTEAASESQTVADVTEVSETTPASEQTEPPVPSDKTEETTELSFNEDYPFNNDDDFFFVVNKQIRLPDDYYIETETVQGSYELEKTAAKYCRAMIEAAKEDGIELKILSAYRTVKYQQKLFDRNVKSRMENYGMSYEEAYADTSVNIAPPGGSEHNAGLAVDIITMNDWDTYEGFEDTKEFAWLQEHAAEYGFIMRYAKEKEDITGYIYEPWHYRYIGVKYAADVQQSGLCLEEYFEKYVWNNTDDEILIDE